MKEIEDTMPQHYRLQKHAQSGSGFDHDDETSVNMSCRQNGKNMCTYVPEQNFPYCISSDCLFKTQSFMPFHNHSDESRTFPFVRRNIW